MGFKCTSILFTIWCTSIFLACFSLQATLGFTCGEFGYTCINHRYYQKCDKEKHTRDIKVISVCPRNTVCVTTRPNPCQPSKPPNPCIPSNANSLQQINLEEEHKLAVQTPEAKAQVNQIIKDKISDSAPLGNIDESTNEIKLPGTTPSSLGSDIPEMKISASTTISSANITAPITTTTPATIGALTTPNDKANIEKVGGKLVEHHTAEYKGDHEKSDKEHEKSEEHKEGHEKSEEHKEGHEKSEEHKEEGHEKSGEHHGEEHKEEGHEKSKEHKEEGHEKSEEHKEGHDKSEEHHGEEHKEGHKEEGHEKPEEHHGEEHKEGHKEEGHEKSEEHHGEEHKEGHKEEGHKEDSDKEAESEDDQQAQHDNAKEDQHAEHGNHEETTKHPEEHTTPASKKQIYGKKSEKRFVCPHPGSFPKEESKECFYVCYRNQRSTNMELKAINVCCPKGMYFNSKIHKCSDCGTKTGKTNLRRRKRHRRRKRRVYLRI